MRRKIVAGNWKMNTRLDSATKLAREIENSLGNIDREVILFPPYLYLELVKSELKKAKLGAQNCYYKEEGAFTGEISTSQLKDFVTHVLVGHSERRHLFHETNHQVREKVEAILSVGLTPVVCVGETGKEREENKAEEVIEIQIKSAYHNIVWPEGRDIFVAYEPVWAVGTGTPCDPVEAERMHNLIKKQVVALTGITPVILYGGSVRPDNAQKYLNNPDINGVLVGGASANFQHWKEIVESIE